MKIIQINEPQTRQVAIANMQVGSVGVDSGGNYYYRSPLSAVCLNNCARSFQTANDVSCVSVEVLPNGTQLLLIVDGS